MALLTVKLDVFPHNGALSLVIFVDGYLDLASVDIPSAHRADEVLKLLALEVQPALQNAALYLTDGLAHRCGNAHAHQFLEPGYVGNQVGVEVV